MMVMLVAVAVVVMIDRPDANSLLLALHQWCPSA